MSSTADSGLALEEIGDRYGGCRQAVYKALRKWQPEQEREMA